MGKQAAFDVRSSRATRDRDAVELLLAEPCWEDLRVATYLQLKRGDRSVRGLIVLDRRDSGPALARCRIRSKELVDGRWQLSVQTVAGPRPIGADLFVRSGRVELTSDGPPRRERIIAAGAKSVDVALAPLSPRRARHIRDKVRRVVRALLK